MMTVMRSWRAASEHVDRGTGSEVMSRIAARHGRRMVSSTELPVVIPALYALAKQPSSRKRATCAILQPV